MGKQPGFSEDFDKHVEQENRKIKAANADKRAEELRAKFPLPDTKEKAEKFFRNLEKTKGIDYFVDVMIKIKKGWDSIRVVFKTKDENVAKIKWEISVDLDKQDPGEYDRLFIYAAREAHFMLMKYEAPKY